MSSDVYIVAAKRTPIGALGGGLSSLAAHKLGALVIDSALKSAGLTPDAVQEVIMGQVLGAGSGQNPARQAARAAGIPDSSTAFGVNQVCGSGLRAVALAYQQIISGDAEVVVAGGQESMSQAPHVAVLRTGKKLGDVVFSDTVMNDGLNDAFYGYPMGITAENVARQCSVGRDEQDAFALSSHQKASRATRQGHFSSQIVPVTIEGRKGDTVVDEDELIRHDANADALAKLRPVFSPDGTVTAGNASGINDGASALAVVSGASLNRCTSSPMARIVSWATTGLDPRIMGLGPIAASKRALQKAAWAATDVDLWEANEAFAAQSLAVVNGLEIDPDRVNVNGGAIALGHPIGASGARILTTLVHELIRRDLHRGVATLCIGGGMGIAMCVER